MIDLLNEDDWYPQWEEGYDRPDAIRQYIDLSKSKTREQVFFEVGRLIRGGDSSPISGRSADALIDVMSDWFIEQWGKEKEIYIRFDTRWGALDKLLLAELYDLFFCAWTRSIHDRVRQFGGADLLDELDKCYIGILANSLTEK
jgi:hypothetical protein